MPKVEIKSNRVYVGGKGIPLVSGEVHYWRLNPKNWEKILDRLTDMGLKMVSTYVPWDYHEYKRGRFDFTGTTDETRNLKAFLDLTRRKGFWVIIRPGPYIYSEWPHEGIPEYAYRYHRLHPQYLRYARNYMQRVVKILKPYFASRKGGHILLLQADNEIDPWPDVFGHQYGLAEKPGLFQEFLRDLYDGHIKDLNACWGTDYDSFEEARPFIATMVSGETGLTLKGEKELSRNIDFFKFKYNYAMKCARWNVQTYRELGVDIPVFLNLYPFFYAHDWAEFQNVSDMVSVDLYPSNELSEDRFEPRKFMDKIRYLKHVSRVPLIAEFQSGIWHGRHYETKVLTPNHYRLITLSAILAGAAGWNWYMLVNRDNWYMSPVNEWGNPRWELYGIFKQMVEIAEKINLPSLEKVVEVAATLNPLQYAVRTLGHDSPILVALYESDTDYELYDPRKGVCDKKVLFYSGNQWLENSSQENLKRYVEKGGTLVAFRDYPRKDDRFQLSSIIGFEEPVSTLFEFKRSFKIRLAPGRPEVGINSSVYCFGDVRGEKIVADLGAYGKMTVGYSKKIGKGKILHLGLDPSPELVREILGFLQIPWGSHSVTSGIKTALFRHGSRYFLVAVNFGNEDKSARVDLLALDKWTDKVIVRDLMKSGQPVPWSREASLMFEIPRKDGRLFELKSF